MYGHFRWHNGFIVNYLLIERSKTHYQKNRQKTLDGITVRSLSCWSLRVWGLLCHKIIFNRYSICVHQNPWDLLFNAYDINFSCHNKWHILVDYNTSIKYLRLLFISFNIDKFLDYLFFSSCSICFERNFSNTFPFN